MGDIIFAIGFGAVLIVLIIQKRRNKKKLQKIQEYMRRQAVKDAEALRKHRKSAIIIHD